MDDLISRDFIKSLGGECIAARDSKTHELLPISSIDALPSAQPDIVRCCECDYWDRDSLRHQCNDFRDWNEAECKILAERDPYGEINRYTEADDYCSGADRRHGVSSCANHFSGNHT